MAHFIECGTTSPVELAAAKKMCGILTDEWLMLLNIPRIFCGREIDALLIGPRLLMVIELKNHPGPITVNATGAWDNCELNYKTAKNPLEQANNSAALFNKTIRKLNFEIGYIESGVVFTNPQCVLRFTHAPYTDRVVTIDEFRRLVESHSSRLPRYDGLALIKIPLSLGQQDKVPKEVIQNWTNIENPEFKAQSTTEPRDRYYARPSSRDSKSTRSRRLLPLAILSVIGLLVWGNWPSEKKTASYRKTTSPPSASASGPSPSASIVQPKPPALPHTTQAHIIGTVSRVVCDYGTCWIVIRLTSELPDQRAIYVENPSGSAWRVKLQKRAGSEISAVPEGDARTIQAGYRVFWK